MMRELPLLLEQAGVTVRLIDGWDELDWQPWVNAGPEAHMHHHTATAAYTPNREKANAWAGLSIAGSNRLYQEDYDGTGEPVYVFANLNPAPISSGAGDRSVLERINQGELVTGRPGSDTQGWYGNRHYWNTEWILDGIGAYVDVKVWDMMVTVARVQNLMMGWDERNHIMHASHTNRKIDLWDGRRLDFDDTLQEYRFDMMKETEMNLERWASRLRKPEDFDQMAIKGIITEQERDYWKTIPTTSAEFQDLRDAVEVRSPIW